jgi:hypothetical protein
MSFIGGVMAHKENQKMYDWITRKNSTITEKVVVEKPVVKEVVKKVKVKEPCPEVDCPPCPECPAQQVLQVDTLKVKGGGDILVSGKKAEVYKKPIKPAGKGAWVMGEE